MEVIDAEYQWWVQRFILMPHTDIPSFFFLSFFRLFRDRRKLTFYFVAEKRIDFRELVRELFRCVPTPFRKGGTFTDFFDARLYKTRIWMASLQGPTYDQ